MNWNMATAKRCIMRFDNHLFIRRDTVEQAHDHDHFHNLPMLFRLVISALLRPIYTRRTSPAQRRNPHAFPL